MVLTIINGVMLVIMIIVAIILYNMITAFAELIVNFVEQNQSHFKNQKHLVEKSNELAMNLKKLQGMTTSFKTITRKMENVLSKSEKK